MKAPADSGRAIGSFHCTLASLSKFGDWLLCPQNFIEISPFHPLIREYHRALAETRSQAIEHESALRHASENLLADSARLHGWTLIAELSAKAGGHTVRPDGTVRDANSIPRGYWEAKDSRDDLAREIERKIHRGYRLTNTIFEDTRRAILFQNRDRVLEADLSDSRQLAGLLHRFYSHTEPEIQKFEEAVQEFEERVPDLARGLAGKIEEAHHRNRLNGTSGARQPPHMDESDVSRQLDEGGLAGGQTKLPPMSFLANLRIVERPHISPGCARASGSPLTNSVEVRRYLLSQRESVQSTDRY